LSSNEFQYLKVTKNQDDVYVFPRML